MDLAQDSTGIALFEHFVTSLARGTRDLLVLRAD